MQKTSWYVHNDEDRGQVVCEGWIRTSQFNAPDRNIAAMVLLHDKPSIVPDGWMKVQILLTEMDPDEIEP